MATENTSTQSTSSSGFSQSPFGRLGDAVGTENLPGFPDGGGTQSGGEGGNQFAGGGAPVSPFDQIRYNIDQAIYSAFPPGGTPDTNTSINTSTLNPFNQPSGGSNQSGGGEGSSFGGFNPFDPSFGSNVSNQAIQASSGSGGGSTGGFGGGDSNQTGSPFASNPQANQIDATRTDLSNFVTAQVNGGNTNLIAEQISSIVSGLVTSLTGNTPSSTVVQESVLVAEVVTPAEENIVIPTDEVAAVNNITNQTDIFNSSIENSSVATFNESIAGSSVTSGYPTQEEFLAILNGGDLNLPDYLSDDAKAYIQGRVSTISGNIGQYQEAGSLFAGGNLSTDGSNPFSGSGAPFGGGSNPFV
ncbi:hypothetical protein WA1_17165 [Scytonema hofmannii PCC 7110]|uniref:Uncharacterized protein n=1 Tax=Scytonema hofmannii PCC 7110 TaxID=128403 RepID=A0A139XAP9_9CYAN|nr:hypothetical protein [Scytonema hofmannii]KYC41759.1 hypothetical protein WA1_17165 [Scytonema hofmannii PCC 7110]